MRGWRNEITFATRVMVAYKCMIYSRIPDSVITINLAIVFQFFKIIGIELLNYSIVVHFPFFGFFFFSLFSAETEKCSPTDSGFRELIFFSIPLYFLLGKGDAKIDLKLRSYFLCWREQSLCSRTNVTLYQPVQLLRDAFLFNWIKDVVAFSIHSQRLCFHRFHHL